MSEYEFAEIADAAPAILWVTAPDGACTYLSRQWYEYTGQAPGAGLGFGWVEAVHPEDRDPSAAIFLRANERREPFQLDYRVRGHDGVYRWAIDAGRPWFGANGEFLGFVGSVLDISKRRAAEDALRASEARYRRLVETAQEGVWIIDASDRTTYVNPRLAAMLGYEADEMIGHPPARFAADDEVRAETLRSLAERRRGIGGVRETRLRHRNGSEVFTLINSNPLIGADGTYEGALATVTDITAHKELERRLLQSQKMEAIGRLAGGIAHDFNNLLTAMAGHARLVLDELAADDPHREDLLEIEAAAARATVLTRQLLTFSRREAFRPVVLDLNELIAAYVRMARRTLGSDIEIELDLDEELPPVRADAVQLEQVLLNLGNNARDAMPDGGTLTIRTRRAQAPDGSVIALVSVVDTGVGMDERTRRRAFEPFFTTKPRGQGTGLGLATAHGIIEQAGGSIEATSEPGAGTCFTIRLPATEDALPEADAERGATEPRGNNERILVVEDEPAVRRLAVRALRRFGYEVVDKESADAAWAALQAGLDIDLVLTDVVMPGMSGRELVRRAREANLPVRLMLMSGYSPDEPLHAAAAAADLPFLEKPFSPSELARAIRAALDSPNGRGAQEGAASSA